METNSYRLILRLTKLCNVVLMTVPVVLGWWIGYAAQARFGSREISMALIATAFVMLYMTYGRIYESFLVSLVRISEMVYSQCLALLMSDGLMYVIFCLMAGKLVSLLPVAAMFASQLMLSVLWCTVAHVRYFKPSLPRKPSSSMTGSGASRN